MAPVWSGHNEQRTLRQRWTASEPSSATATTIQMLASGQTRTQDGRDRGAPGQLEKDNPKGAAAVYPSYTPIRSASSKRAFLWYAYGCYISSHLFSTLSRT